MFTFSNSESVKILIFVELSYFAQYEVDSYWHTNSRLESLLLYTVILLVVKGVPLSSIL
jgi:hypothetical protein